MIRFFTETLSEVFLMKSAYSYLFDEIVYRYWFDEIVYRYWFDEIVYTSLILKGSLTEGVGFLKLCGG